MNYIFIKYAYNSNACRFLIHKLSIEDIHLNIIMEVRNVFSLKKAQENCSFKRMNDAFNIKMIKLSQE